MATSSKTTKTGTREWAVKNVNCLLGCSHDCRYCYARARALQYRRIASAAEWRTPRLREAEVRKRRRKVDGLVMFPSTHDILPEFLPQCEELLDNLLRAGNRVLVVSKPHYDCVTSLCLRFRSHRLQLLFRFTIGALNEELLAYWEPGAPTLSERVCALKQAHEAGYETSVSMEPLLEPGRVDWLIERVEPFVTETIWIGAMNRIKSRVVPGTDPAAIARIEAGQTPEAIRAIYERWHSHPKLRWKDSYRKVLGLGE